MDESKQVFIGTDCGATMSKVGGVWADGTTISTKLHQRPTNSQQGREAVVAGWVDAVGEYLAQNSVGLAIPGPYLRYGVLGHSANMPPSFEGWDFYSDYSRALAKKVGRAMPLVVGNDGAFGGVGEAQRVRGNGTGGVLMLAPGSGLGTAYIDANGLPGVTSLTGYPVPVGYALDMETTADIYAVAASATAVAVLAEG